MKASAHYSTQTQEGISRYSIRSIGRIACIIACACAINFCLFLIVPLLQNLLGFRNSPRSVTLSPREITAEIIQPKKNETQTPRQRIREVSTDRGRRSGETEAMAMRFAPDLSIAGGGDGVGMAATELAAEIFNEGETDKDVVPVFDPPVPYPERARELEIQGTLTIELVIGRDGRVETIDILRSPHPSIAAAARKTVAQWRFTPAQNKGIPVRQRVRRDIEFRLE